MKRSGVKMKKFVVGLVIGFLLATAIGVTASSNIRLVINGNEVVTDVPPQLIDGRVMVPARFVAESLGATVEWDGERNTVVITGQQTESTQPPQETAKTEPEITADPINTIPINYKEEYIGNTIEIDNIKIWDINVFTDYVLKSNERVVSYTVSVETIPNLYMSRSVFGHRLLSEQSPFFSGHVINSGTIFNGKKTQFAIYPVGSVIDKLEIGWSFYSYDEYSDSWKLSGGFATETVELNITLN
jgi:hypothetical protein